MKDREDGKRSPKERKGEGESRQGKRGVRAV